MEIHTSESHKLRKLSDYETVTNAVLKLVAKDTLFRAEPNLDQILSENPRLITVFNHASPLSWIPAPCLLNAHINARGGGHRRPIAVMDRFFYSVPGLREIAKFVSQHDKPLSFKELIAHFERLGDVDLVVFPEGSNCFFGEPDELQPFRSNRFLEIAIRTETPLLLCVHRGSEGWGMSIPLSPSAAEKVTELPLPGFARKFLGDRLLKRGMLTLPNLPKPMEKFSMYCQLYRVETVELSGDRDDVKAQLEIESQKLQVKMKSMLDELDDIIRAESAKS